MEASLVAGDRPTVLVTNDDGIDAPGLRALVSLLVSTDRFHVLVCAPDSEKSAVSHSITWRNAISVKQVDISGATAFAVSEYTRVQWLALGRLSSVVFLLCLYHIIGFVEKAMLMTSHWLLKLAYPSSALYWLQSRQNTIPRIAFSILMCQLMLSITRDTV
ncbi:hypothetical protein AABB24_036125 [Solanum stoloniferum]|uniref:Survival protein SurE-like phosphatase/nucleotidase domain-containing protein n=1 Tax=Solanum stoloniferum TaxID=62892 RepID=A0ABD2RBY2_9SOLN